MTRLLRDSPRTSCAALRAFLDEEPNLADRDGELAVLLARAWPELDGSGDYAMAPYKVARIEAPTWEPPVLSFAIERHGATVMGSTWGELQQWAVDLDAETAVVIGTQRRRVRTPERPLDCGSIAREVATLIANGSDDPRLVWADDRLAVKVDISKALPDAVKETQTARRKRLRTALTNELATVGWREARQVWRYTRRRRADTTP